MAIKLSFQQAGYRALLASGSLKAFYDDVVYWEAAKGANKFFVTFMKGLYAIPNNRQESIGTMEISFPRVSAGFNDSTSSFSNQFNREGAKNTAFMQDVETGSANFIGGHNYNGFIPITELAGRRHFKTTLTSSNFVTRTFDYEVHDVNNGSVSTSRQIQASYFYPFSDHQLSVLREEPTLICNMDKENEIQDGLGDSGFVLIPQNCHQKVKNNIEYYLEKAGLINKTTRRKAADRGQYR